MAVADDAVPGAEWPERFVYVCSATKAAIVNIAPIFHAGIDRLVGMIILTGVNDPENPTPAEMTNAVLPGERLASWARSKAGLAHNQVRVVRGGADSTYPWSAAMQQAVSLAGQSEARVVINLTGGTKPMLLGQVTAWPTGARSPLLVIATKSPLRSIGFSWRADGMAEAVLPENSNVSIDDYLSAYGVTQFNARQREQAEFAYGQLATASLRLFDLAANPKNRHRFRSLNRVVGKPQNIEKPTAFGRLTVAPGVLEPLVDGLEIGGVTLDEESLTIQDEPTRKFLHGGWLEAYIYAATLAAVGNDERLTVWANLEIRSMDGEAKRAEVDLAVLKGDQLHIVEAKAHTVTSDGDSMKDMLSRLSELKTTYLGENGRAWLVMPLLTVRDLERGEFMDRARSLGVGLYVGPTAVQRLIEDLKALP